MQGLMQPIDKTQNAASKKVNASWKVPGIHSCSGILLALIVRLIEIFKMQETLESNLQYTKKHGRQIFKLR